MIDWLLNFLFVALAVTAFLLTVYLVMHRYFPARGTQITNWLVGLPVLLASLLDPATLDTLSGLPWSNVFSPETAKAIIFALVATNSIIRSIQKSREKQAVV
jgi:hypothetical protein